MKKTLLSILVASTMAFSAQAHEGHKVAALETYANIAIDNYSDALADAKKLEVAVEAFVKNPTEKTLAAAKEAWKVSRESYGTTEILMKI